MRNSRIWPLRVSRASSGIWTGYSKAETSNPDAATGFELRNQRCRSYGQGSVKIQGISAKLLDIAVHAGNFSLAKRPSWRNLMVVSCLHDWEQSPKVVSP